VTATVHHGGPAACYQSPGAMTFAQHGAPPARASSIVASGDYVALRAADGREAALRRSGQRWCVLKRFPGAFSTADLTHAGVPLDVAQRLWIRMERFRTGPL